MGLFTKEEKYNKETGKFETTKKGLFHGRGERTPITKALTKKYHEKHPDEKPSNIRRQRIDKAVKSGNKALDTLFGPATKKSQRKKPISTNKQNATKYIIKGGKAYPIAGQKTKKQKPYSIKNNYNPFGDMFDTGMKTSKRGKKKDFDLFDNHGFY